MAQTRSFFRSFAGGELSPEMFGRIDDVKYQSGAAKLRNFVATPQGPAENRAGFAFVNEVKDSTKITRLIPFTFSTTQTMVIELGAGYIRFHTQGGTLLAGSPAAYSNASSTVTISIASPGVVTWNTHGLSNGTKIKLTTTGALPTGLNTSTTYYVVNAAPNTFQLSLSPGGTAINTSGTQSGTHTARVAYLVGDLVSQSGVNYYCIADHVNQTPPNATYWYPLPSAAYEIPSPYAEADLFDIHYVQSADVLTLVHPNYPPRELRRLGATTWTLTTISFVPVMTAPTGVAIDASPGYLINISGITKANPAVITTVSKHNLAPGDSIYIRDVGGMTQINDAFYVIEETPTDTTMKIKTYDGGVIVNSSAWGTYTSGGTIQFGSKTYDVENFYVVTSVSAAGQDESVVSSAVSAINNLYVSGSYNTITWNAVAGAARYNVYKRQSGLYGYIGQSEGLEFVDNNIAPDMGVTPPFYENIFNSAGNYPGAVSYFEQRRAFAGTLNSPQQLWMTRSGTESDMSYSLPIKDDDRISFRVAAREANTIRHIVPLTQLILLTGAAEWRVSSLNSDAITPTTISVRPQSYVGASNVQPQIVNNSLVYCAARGGHVRELGYSWQSNGFITGDVSLRAAHLFDNYEITDMALSKAPFPLLWFVSTTGKLLGLTYVPEQQIGAWHQHDTDGVFESCTVVSEGKYDALYVIVRRTINGVQRRYIERMADRLVENIEHCFFVDAGATFDGTNTGATTMTLSGGTNWTPGEILTLTSSTAKFVFPGTSDVGDLVIITDANGVEYRCKIQTTSSTTVATVKVDKTIPVALRNAATTVWAFARNSVSGITWLEGKTVSILTDGAVHPHRVVTGGTITLQQPARVINFGLPYEADLQTLPMAMEMPGFGQGRVKNINKSWIRVWRSSGIFIGPDANNLTEAKQRTAEPYGSPPALKDDEIQVVLTPTWAQGGQIYMRQRDPLPLTVVGLTLEVSVGG